MPEVRHVLSHDFDCDIVAAVKDGNLQIERRVGVNEFMFPVDQYAELKAFFDLIQTGDASQACPRSSTPIQPKLTRPRNLRLSPLAVAFSAVGESLLNTLPLLGPVSLRISHHFSVDISVNVCHSFPGSLHEPQAKCVAGKPCASPKGKPSEPRPFTSHHKLPGTTTLDRA